MIENRLLSNKYGDEPILEYTQMIDVGIESEVISEIENSEGSKSKSLELKHTHIDIDADSSVLVFSSNTGNNYIYLIDGNEVSLSARTRKDGELLMIDRIFAHASLGYEEAADIVTIAEEVFGRGKTKVSLTTVTDDGNSRKDLETACLNIGYKIDGEFAVKE